MLIQVHLVTRPIQAIGLSERQNNSSSAFDSDAYKTFPC